MWLRLGKAEGESLNAIVIGDDPPLGQSSLLDARDICLRHEDLTLFGRDGGLCMTSSLKIGLCRRDINSSFRRWLA